MVLKCSFPGFILAPRSRIRKEYENLFKRVVCVTVFFLDCYQNRRSLFCSSIFPLPAPLQLCLFGVKEFISFKIRVYRKYLFVFCVCPFCGTVP